MKVEDMARLESTASAELNSRLGIACITDMVRQFAWFGHVERKDVDDWVSACKRLKS